MAAEWIGGCRFKVEQVNNGWTIEFHPSKNLHTTDHRSKMSKHVAQEDLFSLLEVLEFLLQEQAQLVQESQPKPSEQ